MNKIRLADSLSLPVDAATQTFLNVAERPSFHSRLKAPSMFDGVQHHDGDLRGQEALAGGDRGGRIVASEDLFS